METVRLGATLIPSLRSSPNLRSLRLSPYVIAS